MSSYLPSTIPRKPFTVSAIFTYRPGVPGDIVVRDVELPSDITPGDLLATPATGAYGRSMASNYNHVPRPPVVAVSNGKARLIVRRETQEDLLRLEVPEG